MQQVREDFDRIALLSEHEAEFSPLDLNQLLSHVPKTCDRVLEVGCGFGTFTRLLAGRARSVTAIDLSPQMIRVARERAEGHDNLEFVLGDFLQMSLPGESFDCIVTIATLHHLPQEDALRKLKAALKPGGVLVIQDLLDDSSLTDKALDLVRLPILVARRFLNTGRPRTRRALRRAWTEHSKHDHHLTAKEVRRMRDEHFPGAHLRCHFFWRYTLVWRKKEN